MTYLSREVYEQITKHLNLSPRLLLQRTRYYLLDQILDQIHKSSIEQMGGFECLTGGVSYRWIHVSLEPADGNGL